jgi:methionine-rich copper-binding protein CopC
MPRLQLRTGWFAGLLLTPLAWAHTTIQSSIPATETTLAVSPPVIEVTFGHMAQLTSVVVVAEGAEPRKLAFDPISSALQFRLLDPQLAPGRNEIRWKGLSSGDGHVIEGTLVFTVGSAGAQRD